MVLKMTRLSPPGSSARPHGPSPTSTRSPSPPPATRHSRGPSYASSSGSQSGRPKSLGRRVWEALFGICKKQATDTYEMRKDLNEIHTHLQLPHRDIGEAPVFGDPFAEYDADIAAWLAAQEG